MTGHSKGFSMMARGSVLLIVLPVLGLVWGCDGSQSPPDEAEKAKIQEVEKKIKEIHAKKRLP